MYESFKVEIKDHVASVAFNRPQKANSLHAQAWKEMQTIFEDMDQDPEVRVVILSGEGKHFCAGIDLSLLMNLNAYNDIKDEGRKRELIRKFILQLQDNISSIEKCRKPVLAAIHNGCLGGGVDIVSACDMRYCTTESYFCIKEVDMGLVADIGTLQRLPKIIPSAMAAEMAYTGRNVYGPEAKEIGLVNQCYQDKEMMMENIQDIANTIAEKSPLVIRGTKHIIQYTRDHTVHDSLQYMATYNAAYLMSDDLKESFEATIQKRKPVYND